MWKLGVASARARLGMFVGAWLALTLGVALVAACGLLLGAISGGGAQANDLASVVAMLAIIAVFASVFVVGSTFSYLVSQRWREFALLRLSGASFRQVRASVLVEALLVGAAGSLAGCLIGFGGAQALGWAALRNGLIGQRLVVRAEAVPLGIAAALGIGVALVGAYAAARRAGRVRPIEALRAASYERPTMTGGRWVWAALLLSGALALGWIPVTEAKDGVAAAMLLSFLLIGAGTVLSPVLVPPLLWVLAAPTFLYGAVGRLARRNSVGVVRRTASTAAPVLVTVALTVGVVGAATTYDVAAEQRQRQQTVYEYVLLPGGGAGLAPTVPGKLRAVPGTLVTAPLPTTVEVNESGGVLYLTAAGVDQDAGEVLRLRPVAGSLAALADPQTVAVGRDTAEEFGWRVGDRIEGRLEDGASAGLRIVAIVPDTSSPAQLLLARDFVAEHVPERLATAAYINLASGADRTVTLDALRQVAGADGDLQTSGQWLADQAEAQDDKRRLALLLLLGLPMLYTGLAVANTLILATRARAREFGLARLAGAGRAQVIGMVGLEVLLAVGVGATLAAGVVTVTLTSVARAVGVEPVVPWGVAAAVLIGCLTLALTGAVVPAYRLLRRERPIRLVASRE